MSNASLLGTSGGGGGTGPFQQGTIPITVATLGSELVTNGTFTGSAAGWTSTGWTYGADNITHNTGNVSALSQSISQTNTTHYLVRITTSAWTAGDFVFTINGVVVTFYNTIETQVNSDNRGAYVATSTGSVTLAVTPTSTFDGTIDDISVKAVTTTNSALTYLLDPDGSAIFSIRGDASQNSLFVGTNTGLYDIEELASYGINNVIFSPDGFQNNITGYANTGVGSGVLKANGTGYGNTALGYNALTVNTSGFLNTATGYEALAALTYAAYNTAFGANAMSATTTAISCIGIGVNALYHCNTNYNIGIGSNVLGEVGFSGTHNNVVGIDAARYVTTAKYCQGVGYETFFNLSSGDYNDGFGHQVLREIGTGAQNVGVGGQVFASLINGSDNVGLGFRAGNTQTAGSGNIAIGSQAALPTTTGSNQLNIGNAIYGNLTSATLGVAPSAYVHIKGGTTAAGTAPIKLASGSLLTSAEAGAIEYDGTRLAFSPSTTRKRVALSNDVAPTNGQLLIGNGTDYTVASVTAGTNITVTPGAGTLTIAAESLYRGTSASAPSSPVEGWMYYNTADATLYVYTSGAWVAVGT